MAARAGMSNIIGRMRSLVNDAGTVYFTDDRLQDILDTQRFDFYAVPLLTTSQLVAGGSVEYHVYQLDRLRNLEGTASGTVAFRLYDSLGTVITTGFTFDDQNARLYFTANQAGSARYLDGRSFDIFGAAADAWREAAGLQSEKYDFRVEGRAFTRSQWFEHCMSLAMYYESKRTNLQQWSTMFGVIERSDMLMGSGASFFDRS